MPDAKRKLPVLYVPTIDGAPDFDTQECDDGQTESLVVAFASDKYLERYNNERTEAGFVPVEMALYEPAVPRCRTCPKFNAHTIPTACSFLQMSVGENDYCSWSPEARSG